MPPEFTALFPRCGHHGIADHRRRRVSRVSRAPISSESPVTHLCIGLFLNTFCCEIACLTSDYNGNSAPEIRGLRQEEIVRRMFTSCLAVAAITVSVAGAAQATAAPGLPLESPTGAATAGLTDIAGVDTGSTIRQPGPGTGSAESALWYLLMGLAAGSSALNPPSNCEPCMGLPS